MRSNFEFIESDFPKLFQEALEAERYVHKAPKYAALQCRIVLELAVNWLYDNDPDYSRPYDRTLSALMYNEDFKNDIKGSLLHELTLVRKIGNNAAHGHPERHSQRMGCINMSSGNAVDASAKSFRKIAA